MRSLPDWNLFTEAFEDALYRVLEYGYIEFNPTDTGIQHCYDRGWLHRTKASEDSSEPDICVLPSRLHEKY